MRSVGAMVDASNNKPGFKKQFFQKKNLKADWYFTEVSLGASFQIHKISCHLFSFVRIPMYNQAMQFRDG